MGIDFRRAWSFAGMERNVGRRVEVRVSARREGIRLGVVRQ
jgi:hypothetical protein